MGGALKKVLKEKNHRERAQIESREKYGLLEKHKDYVLRAQNFHGKQRRLRALREKALHRNPDEFYFRMQNARTVGGIEHGRREAVSSGGKGQKTLQRMRTQDQTHAAMVERINRNKMARLRAGLQLQGAGESDDGDSDNSDDAEPSKNPQGRQGAAGPKHTLFVDSRQHADAFDAAEHFDTPQELVDQPQNRMRRETIAAYASRETANTDLSKTIRREKRAAYRELAVRLARAEELGKRRAEAELQKVLMSKGARKKVGEDARGVPIYKWRTERRK